MNNKVYDAPDGNNNERVPAYRITHIQAPYQVDQVFFDQTEKKLVRRSIEMQEGFLVEFPRGHSIFLKTREELARSGFSEIIPLIRMGDETDVNDEASVPLANIPIQKSKG